MPLALLQSVLQDASLEHYNVAGFSGGEPTLYPWLVEALACAHECHMRTTVTTHGMLLGTPLLRRLKQDLDLLAISLDGIPTSHNRMRGAANVFETMERRLPAVRESGIPFGFIFTLTQHNLDELAWVAQFAVDQGAGLLQIHPLEETGRAKLELPGAEPDEVEASVAFLEVHRLQKQYGAAIHIQLDLLDRAHVAAYPGLAFATHEDQADTLPLSALISPLVVEPDGTIVPILFGLNRQLALGSLHESRLRDLASVWRARHSATLWAMCRRTYSELTKPGDLPFVNWYSRLAKEIDRTYPEADSIASTGTA